MSTCISSKKKNPGCLALKKNSLRYSQHLASGHLLLENRAEKKLFYPDLELVILIFYIHLFYIEKTLLSA